jgi:outer membrane protein TolC
MLRLNRTIHSKSRPARQRFRLGLVSALAGAALIGCVDQQQEVNNYKKVLQRDKLPQVRVDYTHGEELSLEAALLLANSGSEQLSVQGETYLQSLIQRDRAYSAFMPTISLAPTFSWQNRRGAGAAISTGATGVVSGTGSGTGSTGTGAGGTGTGTTGTGSGSTLTTGGSTQGYTTFNVPVAAHANLFNGFRDVSTLQANQFNVLNQRYTLLNLQATVLLETAQTYYNVMLAERSVEVLTNSARYQDALVADQNARYRAGIAQPLDVAQSQAQAAATHVQLITAQDSVQTNRAMLAFMTNANVQAAALVDRLEVPNPVLSLEQAVAVAQEQRLDILAAAELVRVEQQNLQAAIGEYYPSISLDLNYYLHRQSFPTNLEWAGIITATVPIFSAGEIRADVRNAMSQLRTALYNEWQLIREVRENAQVDWYNLQASRRRIAELIIEVNASQEALRQARERYNVGLAINLDVLNATTQLLTAQLNLAQEEFNYKVFYLDLLRDLGRLPLPSNLKSMSSAAASRPTTEEVGPLSPATQPSPAGLVPMSQPFVQPTTFPAIDFSLQPHVAPSTGPAIFPSSAPASFPSTQPQDGVVPGK